MVASGPYPLLARWIAEGQDADQDELFKLGLACVMDGIDVRLTGPEARAQRRSFRSESGQYGA